MCLQVRKIGRWVLAGEVHDRRGGGVNRVVAALCSGQRHAAQTVHNPFEFAGNVLTPRGHV
jgi:hypothetical protein